MTRRGLIFICVVVAGLCLCVAVASVAGYALYRRALSAAPPETAVDLTGHMVIGFEVASFVPCGSDGSDNYWLNADPGVELYDAYHVAVGEDYTPAFVRLTRWLSPPGEYGRLSAYIRELTDTEILKINTTGACP